MKEYVFDLYIAGHTARSRRAVRNMQELCEQFLSHNYALNIIDVLDHPQVAEEEKIMVTPTLIQRSPTPGQRIIGDLSDQTAIMNILNLAGKYKALGNGDQFDGPA